VRVRSFSHVAITVADFHATVQFYWDVFGAPLVGASDSDPERVRGFFGVDAEDAACKIGWIRIPGGVTLEIFEFTPHQPRADLVWNRLGPTHISFNVHDTDAWHRYLVGKGVEIAEPPQSSPHGHSFFFARDLDGNLIELIDLKRRGPLLRWLGSLGGFVFRHTMYRRYYRPKPGAAVG
jgi:catechol 2,3-dioxygenase-like lactoylglutathione lyase family enzyme